MKVVQALCLLSWVSTVASQTLGAANHAIQDVVPLLHAHAHNDYEHPRPLLDALENGFCSIEADVHLVDGKLLVAHDLKDAKPERTLEALYLEPLRTRARRYGGRIFPTVPSIILLVDVKSEATATYQALDQVLKKFADILTRFEPSHVESKAVTVVISGNRARDVLAEQRIRYAALDGRLSDIPGSESKDLIPLISDDWKAHFQWGGAGELPSDQERKLREIVSLAHHQGRKVRFWGTPDTVGFWKTLSDAGVDLINADDLSGLRMFFLSKAHGSEKAR